MVVAHIMDEVANVAATVNREETFGSIASDVHAQVLLHWCSRSGLERFVEQGFEVIHQYPCRISVQEQKVVGVHRKDDEALTGFESDIAQLVKIDAGAISVLTLHEDAALGAGLVEGGRVLAHPVAPSLCPDCSALVGPIESAKDFPAEAWRDAEPGRR